jgi:hypothetical protein
LILVRRVGRAMFELFRLDDQADQYDRQSGAGHPDRNGAVVAGVRRAEDERADGRCEPAGSADVIGAQMSPRYACASGLAAKTASIAPAIMKGPNGSALLRPPRPRAMTITPARAPSAKPAKAPTTSADQDR